ncbi:MAG: hypothetical protein EHM45_08800, partial [Desulfobacteraceae bacterium]
MMIENTTRSKSRFAWVVYTMVFLFPFEVYRTTLPGNVRLTIFHGFVIGMFFYFLLQSISGRVRYEKSTVTVLLSMYLCAGVLSLLTAVDFFLAIKGLMTHLVLFLGFFYVLCFIKNRSEIEKAFTVMIIVGILVAVMALIQFFGFVLFQKMIFPPLIDYSNFTDAELFYKGQFGFMGGLMRPSAFFGSKERMGSYLLIPFGLALFRGLYGRKHRLLYAGVSILLCTAIVLGLAR